MDCCSRRSPLPSSADRPHHDTDARPLCALRERMGRLPRGRRVSVEESATTTGGQRCRLRSCGSRRTRHCRETGRRRRDVRSRGRQRGLRYRSVLLRGGEHRHENSHPSPAGPDVTTGDLRDRPAVLRCTGLPAELRAGVRREPDAPGEGYVGRPSPPLRCRSLWARHQPLLSPREGRPHV